MKFNRVKTTIVTSTFSLVALLGMSGIANAQSRQNEGKKDNRGATQQQKVYTQTRQVQQKQVVVPQNRQSNDRDRFEQNRQRDEHNRLEQQRQREAQIRLEQQRQEQLRIQNQRNQARYRVYRNNSYYQTDYRGAELLREAVNRGYQQGFLAGQSDRNNRRGNNYYNSSMYRNGNYGYQSYVDSSQYQYYFQQGFERGYQDGYNSRYQYGSYNNGSRSILSAILNGILNIREF